MTTPDQLREIVRFLQERVQLAGDDSTAIAFAPPTAAEMIDVGLDGEAATRLTTTPWWQEMVDDVIETPEFAEPGASAEAVLGYARDVVREYIGKRFRLDS